MGRMWIDSAVEGAQTLLAQDLNAAERRAMELVKTADNPSGRVRALALRVQILGYREKPTAALCLYTEARAEGKRRRASKSALAELDIKAATVYMRAGFAAEAHTILKGARTLLAEEIERAKRNQSRGGRIRYRLLDELKAASWVVSGLTFMEERNPEKALQCALKAAGICSKDNIQSTALKLFSVSAVALNQPKHLVAALHLVHEAEERLQRSKHSMLYLMQLRWNRALLLSRVGLPEDADEIMTEVAEWYAASEYREDAKRARADWERIRAAAQAEFQRRNAAVG